MIWFAGWTCLVVGTAAFLLGWKLGVDRSRRPWPCGMVKIQLRDDKDGKVLDDEVPEWVDEFRVPIEDQGGFLVSPGKWHGAAESFRGPRYRRFEVTHELVKDQDEERRCFREVR